MPVLFCKTGEYSLFPENIGFDDDFEYSEGFGSVLGSPGVDNIAEIQNTIIASGVPILATLLAPTFLPTYWTILFAGQGGMGRLFVEILDSLGVVNNFFRYPVFGTTQQSSASFWTQDVGEVNDLRITFEAPGLPTDTLRLEVFGGIGYDLFLKSRKV